MTKNSTANPERPLSALDVIFTRRSVRAYAKHKLDQATIRALLDAAVRAPTAMHAEPWLFLVIQDEETLKRYSDLAKTMAIAEMEEHAGEHWRRDTDRDGFLAQLRDPGFSVFYDAGTLIVIYGRSKGPFVVGDCWLAAENLMLAACALGLGTCVVGAAVAALNSPEAKEVFGLPSGAVAVAPIVVGVPIGPTLDAPPRRDPEIIWW
jgi:nitroreductase